MARPSRTAKRSGRAPASPPPAPHVPIPTPTAWWLAVAVVAAACIAYSVTFRLYDPDVWQHLAVGRAIWELKQVPREHLWTWPSWGQPEVLVSWGFRALLWPFWAAGHEWGLAVWRWVTTLLAFGLGLAAARRMGVRGLLALVVFVACALVYRQRSMVRPETLVVVLLALELWILETRRSGGPNRAWALPLLLMAWANVHISYYLGLFLIAAYALDAWWGRRPHGPRGLVTWGAAAAAACFVNPWGWRTLAQPFEYFLTWRHEPIFGTISELHPVEWSINLTNGLPLLVVAWPALLLWRWQRHGADWAGLLTCAFFTWSALTSQRFLGAWAVVAAPFLARDLEALTRGWGPRALPVAARAGLAAAACVAVGIIEWSRPSMTPGVGFVERFYPVAAVDFMESHGVGGRMFNPFGIGGYLLWRGWPERDRLPFMDIHQTGSTRTRYAYAFAFQDSNAWNELNAGFAFDHVVLKHGEVENLLANRLDRDPRWQLVWFDDGGIVYVRRDGRHRGIAERFRFQRLPGGTEALGPLGATVAADTLARAELVADLERVRAASPLHARARSLLANVALVENRLPDAREHLRAALALDPFLAGAHRRLGLIALAEGDAEAGRRELRAEIDAAGEQPGLALELGGAERARGDLAAARRWFEREARRFPANAAAAAESLRALGAGR